MPERQGGGDAHARDRHKAPRGFIRLCQSANFVIELSLLLTDLIMDQRKRINHGAQLVILAQ